MFFHFVTQIYTILQYQVQDEKTRICSSLIWDVGPEWCLQTTVNSELLDLLGRGPPTPHLLYPYPTPHPLKGPQQWHQLAGSIMWMKAGPLVTCTAGTYFHFHQSFNSRYTVFISFYGKLRCVSEMLHLALLPF